ncbi:adenosylcobinamide-GDP ribazoletransferase [Clostridium sp. B9]|uniref:adenosylcobinamide-GDP ribazoletransferase n=1 Tax=Clostridium sp. B9 TaxID=3423224 RepID=UPI003D2F26BE
MNRIYKAFNMALSMFTVIPLPKYEWDDKAAKDIMKLYPLIGLVVGLFWYLGFIILNKLHVNYLLMGAIIMAIPYFLTGFLHLDGFMDVCDALLSRRTKEEKLRILKDSRVGAFSVIAVVLLLIIEFSGVYTILANGVNMKILILIPIASRAISGYFIVSKEMLGESSLGKFFKNGTGKVDEAVLMGIYIFTIVLSFLIFGVDYAISILLMGIVAFLLLRKVNKEFGGINGDVAGYILVLMEFTGIIALGIL